MPFTRTDKGKISYPKGISASNRRFCRLFYRSLFAFGKNNIVIACSGGIDSIALAHACAMVALIKSWQISICLAYIDHQLRNDNETNSDFECIQALAERLNLRAERIYIYVENGNTQSQARKARYHALSIFARKNNADVLLAHQANDVAESKLFQFLTGRQVVGIAKEKSWNNVRFARPLLSFTRQEIVRYCEIWSLSWSEDVSNGTDKYCRNRIRHHLIPWIEKNINPGIVKILS